MVNQQMMVHVRIAMARAELGLKEVRVLAEGVIVILDSVGDYIFFFDSEQFRFSLSQGADLERLGLDEGVVEGTHVEYFYPTRLKPPDWSAAIGMARRLLARVDGSEAGWFGEPKPIA